MTLDFPIFAINMDRDVDRWQSVAEQATKFGLNIQRIPAIESQNIPTSELSFVTAGVRAVWKSHMKCMQLLLESSSTHALILEDDFQILNPKDLFVSASRSDVRGYDVIQFGWIVPGLDNRADLIFKRIEDFLFRIIYKCLTSFRPKSNHLFRLRPSAHGKAPRGFIPDNFQPGGHCYMVSRDFASLVLQINEPQFLATDDLYIALAKMRSVRFIRSKKSLARQKPFKKWAGKRFTNHPF